MRAAVAHAIAAAPHCVAGSTLKGTLKGMLKGLK